MTADEIKLLGDSEIETGKSMAIGLGIVSIAALVIVGAGTVALMPDLLLGVVLLLAGLGSAAATGALFWAWRRRNGIIAVFMRYALPAPPSAPSAPTGSALPPAPLDETAETSRAGELELNGTPRLIHGFPAATLMWLCDYLAKGNEWTESQLKNMPVPHLFPTVDFGKSDRKKNTPYTRLFDSERGIFVRAGIIVERGGEGNDKGRLAIKSPLNMMQALKDLDTEQ